MSVRRSLVGLVLLFVFQWLLPGRAAAQNIGGSIHGTITDSSHATVPGVTVVIRNVRTGATRELATDGAGTYRAPLLPPGEYEIRASLTGFQTVDRRGIELALGQDAIVDLTLTLGRVEQEVVVVASAPQVNLASGAVSGLVSEHEIRALPLNGRSFQQLALLQPG
ncbi:MAG: TonB-dependent receptor, partial [Acidobacteria bacterium]